MPADSALPEPLSELAAIVARLEASTGAYDRDSVLILEHQLQCAHVLAVEHPDDVELQIAGLVHDLGWLDPDGDGKQVVLDARHDVIGGRLVERVLGRRVAALVAGHVSAKRYLVATEPAYRDTLSRRSVETLAFQGGAIGDAAIAEFRADPECDAKLALRRADDRAKDPSAIVPGLDAWIPVLEVVAAVNGRIVGDIVSPIAPAPEWDALRD